VIDDNTGMRRLLKGGESHESPFRVGDVFREVARLVNAEARILIVGKACRAAPDLGRRQSGPPSRSALRSAGATRLKIE